MEQNNEQFNWISARTIFSGKEVVVRQYTRGSELWIDEIGFKYHISDLDFTVNSITRKDIIKCFFCGSELCWNSDANANDLWDGYSDEACMHFYTCPRCGRSYEVVEPDLEEKNLNYKEYWQ